MLPGIAHTVPQTLKNRDRRRIQNHPPIAIAFRLLYVQHIAYPQRQQFAR
jgi:hypothetical protein